MRITLLQMNSSWRKATSMGDVQTELHSAVSGIHAEIEGILRMRGHDVKMAIPHTWRGLNESAGTELPGYPPF